MSGASGRVADGDVRAAFAGPARPSAVRVRVLARELPFEVASERHPGARLANRLALVVGVIGLVVVLRELGRDGIVAAVVGTGAWFAVIAAIDVVGSMCDAVGLHGFLRPRARVAFRHVFAAQLGGIAINRLTPASTLGEPVKVTMLVRHVPPDAAVTAVMMFNLCTIYLGIAAIVIGVPLTVLALDPPAPLAYAMWIACGVLIMLAIAVARLVQRGALGTVIGGLVRVGAVSAARGARWQLRVAEIDARLRAIGNARQSGLHRGLAGVVASRCCNWLGTIAVLHAAGISLTAPLVIASLTVGILVTWLSNVIPLGLGVADGTNYALYGLLGASPVAGLLFTMVNRLRTVVLALMGLAVMAVANALHRRAVRSAAEEERVAGAAPT